METQEGWVCRALYYNWTPCSHIIQPERLLFVIVACMFLKAFFTATAIPSSRRLQPADHNNLDALLWTWCNFHISCVLKAHRSNLQTYHICSAQHRLTPKVGSHQHGPTKYTYSHKVDCGHWLRNYVLRSYSVLIPLVTPYRYWSVP